MKKTKSENYLREIIFILFVQKRVIIWTTLIIFTLAVLVAFFWPPTYSASGTILVRGKKMEKSPESLEDRDIRSSAVTQFDLASEVEVLISPYLIEKTINKLKEKGQYKAPNKKNDLATEIHDIQESLKTAVVPVSTLVDISYFDKNKEYAITFLQTLMDQYVEHRMQLYHPEKTEAFFSGQADKFKTELEGSEKDLIDMVERSRTADPQKELSKDMDIRTELEKKLDTYKADAIDKRLYIDQLNKTLAEKKMNFFSFIDNSPINDLSTKLQDLYIERGRNVRTYTEQSEKVKRIDDQIADTYRVLQSEVTTYRNNEIKQLEIIQAKIKLYEERVNHIITADVELKKQAIEQQRVGREIDLHQLSYSTFAKRTEEAKTATGSDVPSFVSIVKKAFPSNGAVFPKKKVVIPLGALAGFLTGCSFGFLRNYFDHTFKKPTDVVNFADLNVIFSIPLLVEDKAKKKSSAAYASVLLALVGLSTCAALGWIFSPVQLEPMKAEAARLFNPLVSYFVESPEPAMAKPLVQELEKQPEIIIDWGEGNQEILAPAPDLNEVQRRANNENGNGNELIVAVKSAN